MKVLVAKRTTTLREFKPGIIRIKWEGKVLKCEECDCKFQLEAIDKEKIVSRLKEVDGGPAGLNDFNYYIIPCPECGTMVEIAHIPLF